jgi:hypothetical protein
MNRILSELARLLAQISGLRQTWIRHVELCLQYRFARVQSAVLPWYLLPDVVQHYPLLQSLALKRASHRKRERERNGSFVSERNCSVESREVGIG